MKTALALLLLAAGSVSIGACATTPASEERWPAMRFDAATTEGDGTAEAWLRLPFPSDERRRPDGSLIMSDMPIGSSIIRRWREESDKLHGFSVQPSIFFAFAGALPTATFPAQSADTLSATSTLQLVDLAPGAAHGRHYPLRWRFTGDASTSVYLASNTLALAPVEGFVLEESHLHAAFVLGPSGDQSADLARALADVAPTDTSAAVRWTAFAPLRAYASEVGIDRSRIVAATLFTTGTPSAELLALADDARARATASYAAVTWKPARSGAPLVSQKTFTWDTGKDVVYRLVGGEATFANYQRGEVPYETVGGDFVDPSTTAPRADRSNVTLTVPATAPSGAACLPLVIYAHGTGGNALSGVDDGTAPRLAARGIATISFDQPMHGLRAQGKTFDVDSLTFNVANPAAFRTTMRQGALDLVQMHAFSTHLPALPADFAPLPLCTDSPQIFAHSQGGLSAAMALGVGLAPRRTVLSGTGGALHVTIAERKDPVDFAGLVRVAAKIGEDEAFDERHPIMGLLQLLGDVSDPAIYARAYDGVRPLLQTAGLSDSNTPFRSATALAVAARESLVGEPAWSSEPLAVVPAFTPLAPLSSRHFLEFGPGPKNLDDSHWVIFERAEAIDASMAFLVDGSVRRNANATCR
jgi:fermentation-respiration switch protein FrsA (DUF1100 family)